ncbi:MAG: peptide ABC transporter substrate-binding protein [Epsilonproteobacteria bacterium]|nr:peptide ABC transporter substrate-binding protein [Campylobacterota bacterium]
MKKLILLLILIVSIDASTLRMSISANPSRINPILSTDSSSSEITQWIFNSLITYDKNAKIKMMLAKSYEFKNKTTLIFHLRKNVKWSDGKPFSAKDVLFTYKTIISPKIFTPYSSSFKHIKSVSIIDDYTVKVVYKYPYFQALETWMMEILPEHILKNEKNLMTSKFNQAPIGTGPYILKKFSISSDIVLVANPNYFIHKPNIDKIVYHYLPDSSANFLMLKSGLLDVGSLTPLQLERQIDEKFKKKFSIYESPSHSYSYMGFNLRNKKFKNPLVRKALSLAINRQELAKVMFFGHAKVCTGPFLPGTGAFNPNVKPVKQDIKEARELLKKAGYDKNHPLTFELSTNTGSTRTYMAQILQSQLKKAGVIVKLRIMEWQAFLNTVVMPKRFEAVLLAWSVGLKPDAYSIWDSKSDKKGGFNFVGYKNKEVDRLIKKAEGTVDNKKFNKIYQKIFKLITDDNPYLFLIIPNSITVVNKKIHPVSPSIIGVMHNEIEWKK